MTTNYIEVPNPNTSPIYPKIPFTWFANLRTQITPLSFSPNTIDPVQMGVASASGAILEMWHIVSLVPAQEPGGSGSSPPPDGEFGLGTTEDPLYLRFYSKRFGSNEFNLVYDQPIVGTVRYGGARFESPILPSPQQAWRIEPYEEIWVGLSKAIPNPGANIFIRGGHYS